MLRNGLMKGCGVTCKLASKLPNDARSHLQVMDAIMKEQEAIRLVEEELTNTKIATGESLQ